MRLKHRWENWVGSPGGTVQVNPPSSPPMQGSGTGPQAKVQYFILALSLSLYFSLISLACLLACLLTCTACGLEALISLALSLSFFRQGYGEEEFPLRRAHCAPPTVAGALSLSLSLSLSRSLSFAKAVIEGSLFTAHARACVPCLLRVPVL